MNIWLAVGAIVAFVLIAIVVFGTRRPRLAEDELLQPRSQPPSAENAPPLRHGSLADVLHTIQAERLTGTLNVTTSDQAASLYFLFGHLFHAVNRTLTGEAAVRECLGWHDVEYGFDKVTPLPTVKTIERPIDQILAA
jgi:hypothetical protein